MPSSNRIAGPLAAYTLTAAFADVPDIAIVLAQRPGPILLIAVVKVGNAFAGVRAPSLQLARDGVQVGGSLEPMWFGAAGEETAVLIGQIPDPILGEVYTIQGIWDTDNTQTIGIGDALLVGIALSPDQARLADLIVP